MKPITIALASLAILLVAACTVQPSGVYAPDSSALYGTAGAVAAQETAVSARLTSTAGAAQAQATGTAVSATQVAQAAATATAQTIAGQTTATSESLAFRATEQALAAESTYSAIAANATGTAVSQVAVAEQRLIADEAARLANQRQNERTMAIVKAVVFILLGLGGGIFLAMLGYRLYSLSQPIEMPDGNGGSQFALPANQYQVLPTRQLSLPEPDEPIIDAEPIQLPRLEKGHVMIVGVTGDGKSMALREIVEHRQNVTVLDPHNTPGAWGQARVIGGGRDFDAIRDYMGWMRQELDKRSQQRANGQRRFDSLTVATEEMPAIMKAGGRSIRDIWQMWMREGRKFGLFMAVVTQSTRVATLGIKGEGDLLENFTYIIELASSALKHYPDLVAGMERPAVLRSKSRVQPIVIPYDPRRDPESPQFYPHALPSAAPMQQLAGPVMIDGVPVSPAMIQQIVSMRREGASQRAIEGEVMGYEGGQAYKIVAAVLEQYSDAVNGRFPAVQ